MADEKSFPFKGYALPLTPKGQGSIIEAPPWHYGGEILLFTFKADEVKARAFVPPPLEMGPNPGEGAVWFSELVSVSETRPDLAFINPERTLYRECLVMIACQHEGAPGYFVPFIWVDNDFTLIRGFVQGFPKKLGRIFTTRLHELNPRIGGKRIGAKVKGVCDSGAQRIVEASMHFQRQGQPSDVPPVRFYLMRHFPSIEDPNRAAVHELTVVKTANVRIADVWAGEGNIEFFDSPCEEVADLGPVKCLGAFAYSMGMSIPGGAVIHKYV